MSPVGNQIIKITVNTTQPPRARFAPSQVFEGDLIYWANNDQEQAHWPAPRNGTDWLPEQIPPGQSSRRPVTLTVSESPAKYYCLLHQDEEGEIKVVAIPAGE
jgi:hypothetical protein